MSESFIEKVKNYPWRKKAKQLIFETPIEIMIGVLLVGSITGVATYRNRSARAGEIPLAFSEIEQTTKDFGRQDKPVPPLTKFYAVNNDITMKVFESNNIALAMGKSNEIFARELRTRVDASFKIHPLISTYAEEMPRDASDAVNSLDKLVVAARQLPSVSAAFSNAWGESHYDVTHTRYWTTTDCDSQGKNCHTTSHSETVYDYTIHTYTFHAQQARRAAQLLNDFIDKNPDLTVQERLYLASTTHAENQEAIAKSMKRELKGKTPTEDQYLQFANTWARGSNLLKYAPAAAADYSALKGLAPAWDRALGTARDARYITYSHYDSGPREYQVAENAQSYSNGAIKASHRILDGIQYSAAEVPQLDAKIKQYVGVVLDKQPGNPDKLRSEIMDLSRKIYQKNYENGFDVQPFKWLDVVLMTLLGMALGGAAGAGADRFLNGKKEEWYYNDRNEDNDNRRYRAPSRDFNWRPEAPTRMPEAPLPQVSLPKLAPEAEVVPPAPVTEEKKPAVTQTASEPPATPADQSSSVKDDPATRAKWAKKYKDITP